MATVHKPPEPLQTFEDTSSKMKPSSPLLSLAWSILINWVLAYLIYQVMSNYIHTSELVALLAAGVPALLDSLIGVLRRRRIDVIAAIALTMIAIGIGLMLLDGNPRVLLVRGSLLTGALGLVFLLSLIFPRPITFYFTRQVMVGNQAEGIAWFNSLWQYAEFRASMRMTTSVWGLGLIAEASIRTTLVFILTIPQFLALAPVLSYGFWGGLFLWTMLCTRRGRKQLQELYAETHDPAVAKEGREANTLEQAPFTTEHVDE